MYTYNRLKQDKASIYKEIGRRHVITNLMSVPYFDELNQVNISIFTNIHIYIHTYLRTHINKNKTCD
jgi:hypothetical protein